MATPHYQENQSGFIDTCTYHAINAFFGTRVYDPHHAGESGTDLASVPDMMARIRQDGLPPTTLVARPGQPLDAEQLQAIGRGPVLMEFAEGIPGSSAARAIVGSHSWVVRADAPNENGAWRAIDSSHAAFLTEQAESNAARGLPSDTGIEGVPLQPIVGNDMNATLQHYFTENPNTQGIVLHYYPFAHLQSQTALPIPLDALDTQTPMEIDEREHNLPVNEGAPPPLTLMNLIHHEIDIGRIIASFLGPVSNVRLASTNRYFHENPDLQEFSTLARPEVLLAAVTRNNRGETGLRDLLQRLASMAAYRPTIINAPDNSRSMDWPPALVSAFQSDNEDIRRLAHSLTDLFFQNQPTSVQLQRSSIGGNEMTERYPIIRMSAEERARMNKRSRMMRTR